MGSPLIALLPGALTIYLGYSSGGYFPTAVGAGCAILAVALVLRLTLAENPLEGAGRWVGLGAAALAGLAVWALVSSGWSDAPGRAVLEFDRAVLYLLAFVLVATLPRTPDTVRLLLLGLVAGGFVVCLGGLLTRVFPDVFSVSLPVLPQRLSYPVSYWNGLGLLAVLTIIGALHLACSQREHLAIRVAGAAIVPLAATTLYFTFSRASIAVALFALAAYVIAMRSRWLVPGILAALPTSAIALVFAYSADELAKRDPTTHAAVEQGWKLAIVLLVCAAAAGAIRYACARFGLDARLDRIEISPRSRRVVALAAAGITLLLAGTAWAAFDVGDRLDRQYDRFKAGDTLGRYSDARERLTAVGNNGRLDHWDVALDGWHEDELKGTGAGTYELTWAQHRPYEFTVLDGHSLYLETLSELGIVGGVLLAIALLAFVIALAARARGPGKELWAPLLVIVVAWMLFAAQDWVWELPAVTLWIVVAGGVALARVGRVIRLPRLVRVVAAIGVLGVAVTPVLAAISHSHLTDSITALKRGDCQAAIDDALAANSALSARAEPYAVLGFCDVRLGKPELAERLIKDAVDRDPDNWAYHYGLALVLGVRGEDPRHEIAVARRLNPKEPLAMSAEQAFRTNDPQKWRRRAQEARLPIQ